jgi:hypothetical protein
MSKTQRPGKHIEMQWPMESTQTKATKEMRVGNDWIPFSFLIFACCSSFLLRTGRLPEPMEED